MLKVYMDNFFGMDFANNLIFFHSKFHPYWQVQLLIFWEYICCPFNDAKQDHGKVLKIISFQVDINKGAISLTQLSVNDILEKIDIFLATANHHPCLHEWQKLAGHLNWLLNVLPWGCLALSAIYQKIAGKVQASSPVPL